MGLIIDVAASRILHKARPGKAVVLGILSNYGLPSGSVTIGWDSVQQAQRDSTYVPVGEYGGVPFFAHERLAAYARWCPLKITQKSTVGWRHLSLQHREDLLPALARWEYTHPTLSKHPAVLDQGIDGDTSVDHADRGRGAVGIHR